MPRSTKSESAITRPAELFFEELGTLIEKRWRDKDLDHASFADIALSALQERPPADYVDYPQIVQWAMSADWLSAQNLDSKFGEPPLTVYASDLFYIEVLFWLDVHTAIHQHRFSGAFHILEGSSLHCQYEFQLKERINARFLLGDVRLKFVECLLKGDSRPIKAGPEFIHATFHLERPTISVVVRTLRDVGAQSQYSYFPPSVAHDPFARRGLMTRQIELLQFLHEIRHPAYLRHLTDLVSQPDFERTFFALKQSHLHLEQDDFARLFRYARARHGPRIKGLLRVFQAAHGSEDLQEKCRLITNPEHRFLVGLLLYLPDRQTVLRFIRRHFDGDPIKRITKWIEEMANTKTKGTPESNILGIRFDETSLLVLKYLLQGYSFAAVKQRLKQEYEPEEVEAQEQELRKLCKAFKAHALFKALFAPNGSKPPIKLSGQRWRIPRQPWDPDAEAATRGIWYDCFLDEQSARPVPLRCRRAMHLTTESHKLIVNPTFRFQSDGEWPNELRCRDLSSVSGRKFLPGYPLAWIEDPRAGVWLPFWARGELAEQLSFFHPGGAAPVDLPQSARDLLVKANILVRPDSDETGKKEGERFWLKLRKEFQARKYVLVRDLLHPFHLAALRRYYRKLIAACTIPLNDEQVEKRYGLHNEPMAAFFHRQLSGLVTRIAGEPVKPSYVYFGAYQPGAVLRPHVDREQCQFSVSFLVDYIPEPEDVSPWPLFVKPQGSRAAAFAAHLGIGDGVVYKGCDVLHYRKALPANHFSTSLFFHFVHQNFQGTLG